MFELISQFHFIRPAWLLMLIPCIAIVTASLRSHAQNSSWEKYINPQYMSILLDGNVEKSKRYPLYCLAIAWIIATLSLAGPVWEKQEIPVIKNAKALVIVWDLSPSMSTEDIKPSRLTRSRLKIMDLLDQHTDGLIGLVAYAGEAHVVTPLTDDVNTIKSLLPGLTPDIMPVSGSNTEMALEVAQRLLKDAKAPQGDILFITDGITDYATQVLLNTDTNKNYNVSFWGVGTTTGGPIPLSSGGFAKNNRGEIVIAKLEDKNLSDLADAFGGLYVPFSNTNTDIDTLLNFKLDRKKDDTKEASRTFDQWVERGPYLLLLLLPFVAFSFRRGWLLSIPFFIVISQPNHVQAFTAQDLWLTPDQQAAKALKSGEAEKAAEQFQDPAWRGIAKYKANDYQSAKEYFAQGETAKDLFNLGNAQTQLGEYDDAVEAYQKALELDPNLTAAATNSSIVQQLAEIQKQQQNEQQQDGEQQDGEQQDGEQQDGQQQDGQQQDGQQQDGQQQDGQQQDGQQQDGQQQDGQQQDGQQQDGQQQDGEQTAEEKQAEAGKKQAENIEKNNLEEDSESLSDSLFNRDGEDTDKNNEKTAQGEEGDNTDEQETPEDESSQNGETQHASSETSEEESQQKGEPEQRQAFTAEESSEPSNAKGIPMTEAQQSLNQWLRKIPDDPSGLLRTKFDYQHKERLQEYRSGTWQPPNTEDGQRW